jgi:hypothetical protein
VNILIHITDVFDWEENNDEIGDESDPLFDGSLKQQEVALEDGKEELSPIPTQIYGSESLKALLREVCYEFKDILSRFVKKEPAKVPPLKLDVDKLEWDRPFNKLPARPQSTANQDEIRKQLHKMLDLGVITPSTSTNWSQVLLAAKSNGSKRFCIDLRTLNKALRDQGWQIPNIKHHSQGCRGGVV